MNMREKYQTLIRRGLEPLVMPEPHASDLITMHALRWCLKNAAHVHWLGEPLNQALVMWGGFGTLDNNGRAGNLLDAILAATEHLEPKA